MGQASEVLAALLLPALLLPGAVSPSSAAEPPDAVLKVYSTQLVSDYGTPWKAGSSRSVSGSGFVIPGHRILTNAHVVSDATFIQVRQVRRLRAGSRPCPPRVRRGRPRPPDGRETQEGKQVVLDRERAQREGPAILARYQVPSDRSEELVAATGRGPTRTVAASVAPPR